MTDRIVSLLERISELDHLAVEKRRREELVERAMAAGTSLEAADEIYDVAEEEGLDPAIAFELVLGGVGVRDLAPPALDNWAETQVEAPADWIDPEPPPPQEAARERHLRTTFRRVRSLIETTPSVDEAIRTFVHEPDVGPVDY